MGGALLPIDTVSMENVIIFGEAAAKQAATWLKNDNKKKLNKNT